MSKLSSSLRPQDVLVVCKLFSFKVADEDWTYSGLGESVGISAGEAHNAVDRCRCASIVGAGGNIVRKNLRDLLTVAAPRIFYAVRGGLSRGMPTGIWAPPLLEKFERSGSLPTTWPCETGPCERGESVDPIYPSAPIAARDPLVYELLALVDVIRVGGAADRNRAIAMIDGRTSEK